MFLSRPRRLSRSFCSARAASCAFRRELGFGVTVDEFSSIVSTCHNRAILFPLARTRACGVFSGCRVILDALTRELALLQPRALLLQSLRPAPLALRAACALGHERCVPPRRFETIARDRDARAVF